MRGELSDNVRCTLYVVDLSSAPQFDALSYTWGDPHDTKSIQVNDTEFRATTNLEAFLRQRQTENGTQRPLWIDAICINQTDLEEKRIQVSKMADIYDRCTWLTIWLGPGTMESNLAIPALINAANGEIPWDHNSKEDKAIQGLFQRAWWTRVWVVQEIAFGAKGGDYDLEHWENAFVDDQQTRLVCGAMSIGWGQLMRASLSIGKSKNTSEFLKTLLMNRLHALDYGRRDVREDQMLPEYSQLLTTLSNYRDRQSTDPRDKVFAILQMVPKLRGDVLQPNYSIPFDDVLRLVVQREVSVTQTLNILRYCQRRNKATLSSWTPDWSQAAKETIIQGQRTACVKSDIHFSDDLQSLTVKAIFWDTIDVVLDLPIGNDPHDMHLSHRIAFLKAVHHSREFVRQARSCSPYGSEQGQVNAFWKILFGEFYSIDELTGDCLGYAGQVSCLDWLPSLPAHWRSKHKHIYDIGEDQDLETWITKGVDLPNNPFGIEIPDPFQHLRMEGVLAFTESKRSSAMSAFQTTSLPSFRHIIGRKLFVTKKGFLGLGPPNCVEDDTVAILLGAEVPFILRSLEEHFQLVGEAYVLGIMLGEVMDQLKRGDINTSSITLR